MPNTILVGVDGSETSTAALKWAVEEAGHRGAALHAVTVHMAQGHMIVPTGSRRGIATVTTQSVHADCVNTLTRIVGSLNTTVPIKQTVLVGRAEEVLADLAHDSTLLVLGAHGDSRLLTGLTLGATTLYCLRHATCPVVVIPTPTSTTPGTHHRLDQNTHPTPSP